MGCQLCEQRLEGRLGGGAEHRCHLVILNQLPDGFHAGPQIGNRQGLGLIKDDHAIGDVVKFAAAGRAVPVERFKELHRRGDDDRSVPVFSGQSFPVKGRIGLVSIHLVVCAGVMLDDIFFSQHFPENFGGLVDDGGIGDHINHPVLVGGLGMGQGEGQRGDCFAAPGRNCQGVEPAGSGLPGVETLLQDFTALLIEGCGGILPGGNVLLQALEQNRNGIVSAPGGGAAQHKGFGVQKIRVHQAGVQHPNVKGFAQIVRRDLQRPPGRRQSRLFGVPGIAGGDGSLHPCT